MTEFESDLAAVAQIKAVVQQYPLSFRQSAELLQIIAPRKNARGEKNKEAEAARKAGIECDRGRV